MTTTPRPILRLGARGWRAWTFASTLALLAAPALALDPNRSLTQYMHDVWKWSPALGAPFGAILALGQTSDGYLLVGTESDGLLRFDGVRFVRDAEFDRLYGKNGRINALATGPDGALWVATQTGLARRMGGKWTALTKHQDTLSLALAPDGDLLVGTRDGGLLRWRGERSTRLAEQDCTAVAVDSDGEIWAGVGISSSFGLLRIRNGQTTTLGKKDGLPEDAIAAANLGPGGNLWVASRSGLIRVRDGRVAGLTTRRDGLPSDDLTAVFEDGSGSVWVGTGANGIARLRGGRVESFGKAQGFPGGAVTAFYEDREGSLWVATKATLSRFKAGRILPYGEAEGLALDRATSIIEGRDGSVWVWSDGGGLSQIQNGRVVRVFTTRDGLASNFGGPLFESRDGAIWVGHDHGMSRLKDGHATAYREGKLGSSYIPMITEDAQGILTFVFEMGLVRFHDGKVTPYPLKAGPIMSELPMPFTAHWSGDGTLWLGTGDGAWTLREGVLTKVWSVPLGLSLVMTIHEDSAGAVWLATFEGLYRLQGGRVAAITTDQGMPDNRLSHLIEDRLGYFWIGSPHGIVRVKKQELEEVAAGLRKRVEPEVFGSADGMRMAEVNAAAQPSGWAARDGRLWFATRAGAVVLDPGDRTRNAQPPSVVIEDVIVDGRSRGASPRIRFEADTTRIEVQYTALSLFAPEKVRFKYTLEGFDHGWVDPGGLRVAQYTNLRPGAYRFRVIAANNDGVWNQVGASLDLRQLPHFYETISFYTSMALIALGGGFGVHRLRVRHHLRIERELEAGIRVALADVKTLSGLLPICAWCKKVRDDTGYWNQIETYVRDHTQAEFSHGICPDCHQTLVSPVSRT